MKKSKSDDVRPEYHKEELGQGVRGKYLKSYKKSSNLVLLRPEIAAAFPTDEAVNKALSTIIEAAEHAGINKVSPRTRKKQHTG
ncbi:MAG: hypothetical protein ABUK01_18310 [Leptospirales bacterium]